MKKNISKTRSLLPLGGSLIALMPNLALGHVAGHPNNAGHPHTPPLHRAVTAQNLNAVHDALMADMRAANRKITNGMTALHLAVLIGNLQIVEELIRGGANPHADDDIGDTPLHIAARTGNLLVAEYLLRQFVDADVQDDEWRTPLHWAAWNNDLDMIQMLINYGADPTLTTRVGHYARDFAQRQNCRNLLTRLMQ